VHEVALAVKVVKSEKCLFDDAFSDSNWEDTVGLQPTQAIDVRPKDVGDKACEDHDSYYRRSHRISGGNVCSPGD